MLFVSLSLFFYYSLIFYFYLSHFTLLIPLSVNSTLLITLIVVLGILSCVCVKALASPLSNLPTIFLSKTVLEVAWLTGTSTEQLWIVLTACILNITRAVFKNWIVSGISVDQYKEIEEFDTSMINIVDVAMTGDSLDDKATGNQDRNVRVGDKIQFSNKNTQYNSVALFALLCNDPIANSFIDKYRFLIFSPESNTSTGITSDNPTNITNKVPRNQSDVVIDLNDHVNSLRINPSARITQKSIRRLSSKAERIFKILTQGFDSSLNFQDFRDNLRQINIELNSLRNSKKNTESLTLTFEICLWILFCALIPVMCNVTLILVFPWILNIFMNLFGSFAFILYVNPYNIGDRVYIDGDNLIVKRIGLTSTVFERWNNEEVIYPNSLLQNKAIQNVRRSRNQHWTVSSMIKRKDIKKVQRVDIEMKEFCEKSPAFCGVQMSIEEIVDCKYLRVNFRVIHSINHQNGYFMWAVQNRFMKRLVWSMKRNKIEYYPLDNYVEIIK